MELRRSEYRWLLTIALGTAAILWTSLLVGSARGEPTGVHLFIGLVALTMLVILVRVFRQGIFADDHGVTFRNILRTHRMPWDQIHHFEPPIPYLRLWNGLRACLNDGRTVHAQLYTPTGLFQAASFGSAEADALNTLLYQHRPDLWSAGETT